MWVYRKTEETLYTVGFYTPNGDWISVSDHHVEADAIERVHYLNGGISPSHDVVIGGTLECFQS